MTCTYANSKFYHKSAVGATYITCATRRTLRPDAATAEPAASGPLKAVTAPDRHCTWMVTGSLTALCAFFRLNCAVYVPRSTFGSLF